MLPHAGGEEVQVTSQAAILGGRITGNVRETNRLSGQHTRRVNCLVHLEVQLVQQIIPGFVYMRQTLGSS
jgi:hypothetical protein